MSRSPSAPRIKAWGLSDKAGSAAGAQHGFTSHMAWRADLPTYFLGYIVGPLVC